MKQSIIVETFPTTIPIDYSEADPLKKDVLEVCVEYSLGGTSMLTGARHARGYRISASPIRIGEHTRSHAMLGKGGPVYAFIKEAARFHRGTLEKLAAECKSMPEYQQVIDACLARNHCQLLDQPAVTPEAPAAPALPPMDFRKEHSPWGKVDGHTPLGDLGFLHHSTPSHGGIYVPTEMLRRMPKPYRSGHWYEEDCEWAKVALSFPSGLSERDLERARNTAINWFPHEYMAVTGETIAPEQSHVLTQERMRELAKDKLVVISAWGSWCKDRAAIPDGWVGCYAVLGGRNKQGQYDEKTGRYLLVPDAEYKLRTSFGFIIEKDYPAWPPAGEEVRLPKSGRLVSPEEGRALLSALVA